MATPIHIREQNFQNPGNGFYRLRPYLMPGISSLTVMQPDPAVPLEGLLVVQLGGQSGTLDLADGARHIGIQGGPVPYVDLALSGVDPKAEFTIILL